MRFFKQRKLEPSIQDILCKVFQIEREKPRLNFVPCYYVDSLQDPVEEVLDCYYCSPYKKVPPPRSSSLMLAPGKEKKKEMDRYPSFVQFQSESPGHTRIKCDKFFECEQDATRK